MGYPRFDAGNAVDDFSQMVPAMSAAAKAAPVHTSISTAMPSQSVGAQNISTPSRTARSSSQSSPWRDAPVGSSFFAEKPPIDYSRMDDWTGDQTKQFDAAQALFPCAEDYSASGSSYSVFDFIKAAVNFLSPEYAEKQKNSISEAMGAHFEHFRVDLAGPAPCKWEEARTSFALKEAVAHFVRIYAKAVHSKTHSSNRRSIRRTYEAAMGFVEPYVGLSTSRPVMVSPLYSASVCTPTRDTFRFSSPIVDTPQTPSTPLSATPSIDFGSTARPLQFYSPPSAPKVPRLGRSPRRNGVQGLILFQDIPDFHFPTTQDELSQCAAAELEYEQIEAKMQEVRSLELQLQLLESRCARYDARIYRLDVSSVCATSITPTGALFNLDFLAMDASEQVLFLDSQIEKLQLAIDSTELLNDLKETQLAMLEQNANATKQYRGARKAAWDVLQLRAKKLKAKFRYDNAFGPLVAQSKGASSPGKKVTVSSSRSIKTTASRASKINDEICDSIFRSICMEVPARRSVRTLSSSSDEWSDIEYQHGSREVSSDIPQYSSSDILDTISEAAEQEDFQLAAIDQDKRERHDSPCNEPEPCIPQYSELEHKITEQEETLASDWSIWPTATHGAAIAEATEHIEETGYNEDAFRYQDSEPIIRVADYEALSQDASLAEPSVGDNSPRTPSFHWTASLDALDPGVPDVIDRTSAHPGPEELDDTHDLSSSDRPMSGMKTVSSLFEDYQVPSRRETLGPIASGKALNRLSKVSELAKMFEATRE